MEEKMILYIFVLLIYQPFTEVLSCPTSTATISYVSSCPINQEEWEKASKMKNCEGIAAIQNCTTPAKFVYHCLMNHWRNATLEVCAPIFYIQGYCAEYNTRVKQVVENYNEGFECLTFPEPQRCPPRYASNEAYKYQACYSYQHKQTTTAKSVVTDVIYITKESRSEDNGVECLEFIIVLGLFLPLFLLVLVLGFVINREQLFKLLPEGCTSRCPSMPSGNQSSDSEAEKGEITQLLGDHDSEKDSEAEKGEITQLLGDHDSEKDPMIDLPDIKTNAIMHTISEKDTENIDSQFKEQNIKTSLPDERKDSSDEESNAATVSDEAPESIGNKSTNQSIKTPLPEEETSSTNMESSVPTVFEKDTKMTGNKSTEQNIKTPLPEEGKSSINLKLSVPTVSGTDTESIGNKSTGQSIEISLPGEKSSTNVESSVPNEHDPPPILRSENTQGSHVNEEDTGNIDNKSTEQNIKDPSPIPRLENVQESHVNEKDTESIAYKSTEQSIKTPMSDEQKVLPSMKSSTPTQSEDGIAIKKSENDQEGHVNENDTESIDDTSTEQSMRTTLPDEQTVLPSTESSAPTQSGKDTETIGKGSIEQNMKRTDTVSTGNKSIGQSIETPLPDQEKISPSMESSTSTQSGTNTESTGNKSTGQSIETTLPDQQNVLPSMESSAPTESETDTESIGDKSTEQSMKTPLPDQQAVLPSMTSSAATQSDQDIASLNENPSNSKAVERPFRKSKKAPLPPPMDTPKSLGKKSSETGNKIISDEKHSSASVSKLGKNKQAPSAPPEKVNKSKN